MCVCVYTFIYVHTFTYINAHINTRMPQIPASAASAQRQQDQTLRSASSSSQQLLALFPSFEGQTRQPLTSNLGLVARHALRSARRCTRPPNASCERGAGGRSFAGRCGRERRRVVSDGERLLGRSPSLFRLSVFFFLVFLFLGLFVSSFFVYSSPLVSSFVVLLSSSSHFLSLPSSLPFLLLSFSFNSFFVYSAPPSHPFVTRPTPPLLLLFVYFLPSDPVLFLFCPSSSLAVHCSSPRLLSGNFSQFLLLSSIFALFSSSSSLTSSPPLSLIPSF